MKLKALFAVVGLCVSLSAFAADDKPVLKDDADPAAKAAIEAAVAANDIAEKAGFAWVWAEPQRGMWEGSLRFNSEILDQAIKMANEGKNEEAINTANYIKLAADAGQKQAELSKDAGPIGF